MVSGCGADWVWRKQQQEVAAGSSDFEGSFSAGKVRIVGAVVERDGKFLMVERLKRSRGFFEFPGLPFCPAPLSSLSRRRIGTRKGGGGGERRRRVGARAQGETPPARSMHPSRTSYRLRGREERRRNVGVEDVGCVCLCAWAGGAGRGGAGGVDRGA
eukprot:3578084-Rhodomonas_salina.1